MWLLVAACDAEKSMGSFPSLCGKPHASVTHCTCSEREWSGDGARTWRGRAGCWHTTCVVYMCTAGRHHRQGQETRLRQRTAGSEAVRGSRRVHHRLPLQGAGPRQSSPSQGLDVSEYSCVQQYDETHRVTTDPNCTSFRERTSGGTWQWAVSKRWGPHDHRAGQRLCDMDPAVQNQLSNKLSNGFWKVSEQICAQCHFDFDVDGGEVDCEAVISPILP